MKPGATVIDVASMTVAAGASSGIRPIAAIVPSMIPTSAGNHGLPVPSTTRPFLIRTSNNLASSVRTRDQKPGFWAR